MNRSFLKEEGFIRAKNQKRDGHKAPLPSPSIFPPVLKAVLFLENVCNLAHLTNNMFLSIMIKNRIDRIKKNVFRNVVRNIYVSKYKVIIQKSLNIILSTSADA